MNKKLSFEEKKKKMLEYKDFFGGGIIYTDKIESATTEKELVDIFWEYDGHLDDMFNDARSHLESFKRSINVSSLNY